MLPAYSSDMRGHRQTGPFIYGANIRISTSVNGLLVAFTFSC